MKKEKKTEENGKSVKKSGFGMRLANAIAVLLFCLVPVFVYFGDKAAGMETEFPYYVLLGLGGYGLILLVLALLSKKSRAANGIFLGVCSPSVLVVVGIFGIIGASRGLKYLPKKEKVPRSEKVPASEAEESAVQAAAEPEEASAAGEQKAVSAVKMPNKKLAWGILWGMVAYYALWAVLAVLSIAMPEKGIAWGPFDDADYTYAMNFVTGFIMLLLLPSLGYYLCFQGPFSWSKKTRAIIVAVCIGVSIAGDVLFFLLLGNQLKVVRGLLKIAPVFSQISLLAVYGVRYLNIPAQALEKKTYEKSGETWKDIFGEVGYAIANVMKAVLRVRHSVWFSVAATVLLTLCTFALLEGLLVLFIVLVLLFLIVLFSSVTVKSSPHEEYSLYIDGKYYDLKYSNYDGFHGAEIYKDGAGNKWATEDGGRTFFPQELYKALDGE